MAEKNMHEDARIVRTKAALAQALKQILAEKDFEDITICEICARAKVSRAAFYAHFKDKYDLMKWSMSFEIDRIAAYEGGSSFAAITKHALSMLRNNEFLCRRIALGKFDSETAFAIEEFLAGLMRERIKPGTWRCRNMDAPTEMSVVYCAHGCSGVALWWVRNGFPVSEAQAARMIDSLVASVFVMDE